MTKNTPKVSINILNWNRKKELKELLLNLKNQSYQNYEIILIDNNSIDGSFEMVKLEFPEINVIKMPLNLGVPGGRNVGIVNSLGEIIIFLDNDTEIKNNFIENVVRTFEKNTDAGILTFKILNFYSNELDMTCWVLDRELIDYEKFRQVNTFLGGGCAIRKTVINEIGLLWDKLFFMHEEKEYSMRLIESRYKIYYCPGIEIYHKISPEKRFQPDERFFYFGIRNEIWIYLKNVPLFFLIKHLVYLIGIGVLYSLRRGYFIYFIKGVYEGIFHCSHAIKDRRPMSNEDYKIYLRLLNLKKDNIITRIKRFVFMK